jgi:hypothetical protein
MDFFYNNLNNCMDQILSLEDDCDAQLSNKFYAFYATRRFITVHRTPSPDPILSHFKYRIFQMVSSF